MPATPTLSWNSIPDAAGYLVYLANDRELTNLVTTYAVTTNTVWRPPRDLADNTAQDSYFWYVRPCKSISPLRVQPRPGVDPVPRRPTRSASSRRRSHLQTPANGGS